MNFEKNKHFQSAKVIVSEIIMVLAVIVTVIALAFIVSGYWLSSDFEIKRQGLLQIYSIPTGADVYIDGNSSWLQRTNTSKVLLAGDHTVRLEKEGYDSWEKNINISEGLLYRIHYPRLFLKNRYTEKVLDAAGTTHATMSPDHDSLLLINDTTEWEHVSLDSEKLEPKKINISRFFTSTSLAEDAEVGLFAGQIIDVKWSADGSRALFEVGGADKKEWVLIDFNNIENSVNLTKEFGANFSKIKIFDRSANILLAVQNNNLHKIDVPGRMLSAVIVEGIVDFDHYDNEIIFSAKQSDPSSPQGFYVGKFKISDSKVSKIRIVSASPKVAVLKFYEDIYLAIVEETSINLYNKNDELQSEAYSLSFDPDGIQVGHDGQFIIFYNSNRIATLDMEAKTLVEWPLSEENFGWLDNNMIYNVQGGELVVYDYDGSNRRTLAKNTSSRFPAGITNNRYLYYFSDDTLIREWLIPR